MITEDKVVNHVFYNNAVNMYENIRNFDNISVLWSGGCDSTLVLSNLLYYLDLDKIDKPIYTYAFIHDQLGDKLKKEKQCRNEFLVYCKQKYPKIIINHQDINILQNAVIATHKCSQPGLWITNLLPLLSDNTLLFSGYHMGDCFWSYDIFSSWLKLFVGLCNLAGKDNILPIFPLQYHRKDEIIKELMRSDIYKFCWWCEIPNLNLKPCGRCLPCILHDMSLLYINKEEYKMCEPEKIEPIADEVKAIEKESLVEAEKVSLPKKILTLKDYISNDKIT
jgi:7-cyano-7-deazaguanine synthase in queuosine biosynthesis